MLAIARSIAPIATTLPGGSDGDQKTSGRRVRFLAYD